MTDPGCVKGTLKVQIARVNLFLENYGASKEHREQLLPMMLQRIEFIVEYMQSEAEKGNRKFQRDIEAGQHNCYLKDIGYLKENADKIRSGLRNCI